MIEGGMWTIAIVLLLLFLYNAPPTVIAAKDCCWHAFHDKTRATFWFNSMQLRGGETKDEREENAFSLLAHAVRRQWYSNDHDDGDTNVPEIVDLMKAFHQLSESQKMFKGLDGFAHEAYQRTSPKEKSPPREDNILQVAGRATRTAARTNVVASALEACEFCELLSLGNQSDSYYSSSDWERGLDSTNNKNNNNNNNNTLSFVLFADGTVIQRKILFQDTLEITFRKNKTFSLRALVLYDSSYKGGCGINYGHPEKKKKKFLLDINNNNNNNDNNRRTKGGLLIIVLQVLPENLEKIWELLSEPPCPVRLLASEEAASVQPVLHQASSLLLNKIEPILSQYNSSAIHIVGHSLAGGIASIAATILQGSIPLSSSTSSKSHDSKRKKKKKKNPAIPTETKEWIKNDVTEESISSNHSSVTSLQGFGRGRTSAVTLGAPPSISSNVQTDFIVSLLYGDDCVGRATNDSLQRFFQRTQKVLQKKLFSWSDPFWNRMTDTIALTTFNIQNYIHGSEGEEARLSIPGRAYLLRPRRRLGGACSIHEIGNQQLKGGREAIRASILWQLNDILLSSSLWKHHFLESYIRGLDRVQIRGIPENTNSD